MATAGRTLRVALVANTKNFRSGMMSAVRDAKGFQGKMSAVAMSMRGTLGPALAGAAAAVGALAIKMGVDGVKAAMDEQKALVQLNTALKNVGQGFAQTQVDQFIDDLMFATGVADDELRPAFVRLVTATEDAAKAQDLLSLALDLSAQGYGSVETVSRAFAKAASGQTTALRRLGIPLDAAALKSGDLAAITDDLSAKFGGAAAAAADTMAGRMQILQIAAGELQEAFGTGVIGALSDTGDSASDLSARLRDLQDEAQDLGETVGDIIGNVLDTASVFIDAKNSVEGFLDSLGPVVDIVERAANPFKFLAGNIKLLAGQLTGNDAAVQEAMRDIANVTPEAADAVQTFGYQAGAAAEETEELVEQISYLEEYVSRTSAILDYEESWDNLRKTLRENGKQFDFNSKKGRENNRALIEYAENTAAVAGQQETLFGKTAYVQDALGNLAKTFDRTKMSPETQAAMLQPFQALIDDLSDAGYDVSSLQQQIDRLQGKNIPITVTTTYVTRNENSKPPHERASGGVVNGPGTSTSDSIPTMLSNGEFVIRAASVRKFGAGLFQSLNSGINPLQGMSTPSAQKSSGLTINGGITVNSVGGERADTSLPRALRRMAYLAGM